MNEAKESKSEEQIKPKRRSRFDIMPVEPIPAVVTEVPITSVDPKVDISFGGDDLSFAYDHKTKQSFFYKSVVEKDFTLKLAKAIDKNFDYILKYYEQLPIFQLHYPKI
jgi:hypothetical protein